MFAASPGSCFQEGRVRAGQAVSPLQHGVSTPLTVHSLLPVILRLYPGVPVTATVLADSGVPECFPCQALFQGLRDCGV